ncbi:hypothetical protein VPH35_090204 [Triticum aestivum]
MRGKICDSRFRGVLSNATTCLSSHRKKNPDQNLLSLGAKLIEWVVSEVYLASQGWRPGVLRLDNGSYKTSATRARVVRFSFFLLLCFLSSFLASSLLHPFQITRR